MCRLRRPGGYWFEKARAQIEAGNTKRAGLLATRRFAAGANRKVLKRIKETGDIIGRSERKVDSRWRGGASLDGRI